MPSDPVNPPSPGTVVAGKYRVDRILGRGGMGVVVEAHHLALDERVALKLLLPEHAQVPEASARFLREARNAVKIKSEHVARVSDVGTLESGAPYMVMEFLEGDDLSGVLQKKGVLTISDACDYIIQGCEAIAEAHSLGIIHRDLKPANLFLSKRPDGTDIVKVLDFGISRSNGAGVDNLTRTTTAMGSALYMSPEQMRQSRAVDHRTDVYALGISLYELLAGKQPFHADTLPRLCAEILQGIPQPLRDVRPEVPEALARIIERAYARDRDHRYQSIAELVIALAPYAPPRAQQTVERVARIGRMPLPEAAPGSSNVFAAPATSRGPAMTGQPAGSKAGAFMLVALATLAVVGIAMAIALKVGTVLAGSGTATTTSVTAPVATAAPPAATSAPPAATSAPPVDTRPPEPAQTADSAVPASSAPPAHRDKPLRSTNRAAAPTRTAAPKPGLGDLPDSVYDGAKR